MKHQELNKSNKQEEQAGTEFIPDSKSLRVDELEDREEMIVLWRRGQGALPKDQTHRPQSYSPQDDYSPLD